MSNLNSLTSQEIYDIVKSHLLTQNRASKVSVNSYLECAYRGNKGAMCAIGCLIPDDVFLPEMEGKSPSYIIQAVEECDANLKQFFKENKNLLGALQGVHDHFEPTDWPNQLCLVAKRFQLIP